MRKKKILLIDDDEMNLQIAKMILEKKLACEVVCAASGIDGLKILRRKPFMPTDLIKRVEKKLAEIHSEEILIIGDDEEELRGMKEIIEEKLHYGN